MDGLYSSILVKISYDFSGLSSKSPANPLVLSIFLVPKDSRKPPSHQQIQVSGCFESPSGWLRALMFDPPPWSGRPGVR